MPVNTWSRDWNTIIRNIIFKDETLKDLMLIPDGTNILTFIERYFVQAGYTNELLENEKCRIVYSHKTIDDTSVPNVKQAALSFDIYVKKDYQHNATNDRLENRTDLIAQQLYRLLTKNLYTEGYRFWIGGEGDLGTKTIGYARHEIIFHYMKVY